MAVVVRRDLNLPPGLLAAQVLHIGMCFVQKRVTLDLIPHALETLSKKNPYAGWNAVAIPPKEIEWIHEPYVAVLAVDTPEELQLLITDAQRKVLPIYEWYDVIPSTALSGQFIKCLVGIAIGPADADHLKKVTGTLPLY
jgi:peptidyl-tRNA hydrolase